MQLSVHFLMKKRFTGEYFNMSGNAQPILDKRGNNIASTFLHSSFIDSYFLNMCLKKKAYIFRFSSFSNNGVAAFKMH